MKKNHIILFLFVLLALVQLFVPAKMVFDRENIINTGKEYKFKTAPVDPIDAMRGKYIALSFDARDVPCMDSTLKEGDQVYGSLKEDSSGFWSISDLSKTKPNYTDFLKVKIEYKFERDSISIVSVELPFERYYMEEFKAPKAEHIYNEQNRNREERKTCAVVKILDGEAVLTAVLIDNKPIEEYIKIENDNEK